MTDVPNDIMEANVVAFRWKFSDDGEWHYGSKRPGPFRFGDPDIVEPLFSEAALLAERERRTPDVVTWQPIETAPRDKTHVIVAVPDKDLDGYTVGEAYFDPENYGDGDWWWAGTSVADHFDSPMSDCMWHEPTLWQPLPAAPSLSSGTGRSEE
ncbi:hypothetical protein SAMN05892877_11799 [Rhizobium subbaraonis]|uniref:DUF551 domain-containing protein n=1 Tax=Rhizobium subbaraonis TaxID=908946 RepID=A0A285UV67_9HYPH|nr:hypothetical protein [Rhizobium subbaraonis]SOC45710.1 hypothetical protein SAMN05892877_11799 [Rhizobium subbaraonis]